MPDLERLPARVAAILATTGEPGTSPSLAITAIRERPRSTLVSLAPDGRPGASRILVKIPRPLPEVPSSRPRLLPLAPLAERARLEFEALRAVEQDLAARPDPRFGAVHVFGLLEDLCAVVMTEVDGVSLVRLVRDSARWRRPWSPSPRSGVALGRAGAWLRRYQGLPLAAQRPVRLATRDEFVDYGHRIGEFLAMATGRPAVIGSLVGRFAEIANEALPASLPLGAHHGDFAMRNVIVDAEDRVVVIDMLARWRMPLFDDAARMLVALETSRDQAYTLGLALGRGRIRFLEDAFLAGYDDPPARAAVHAYAALLALDKWAALREAGGNTTSRARIRNLAVDRHFAAVTRRLLEVAAGPA